MYAGIFMVFWFRGTVSTQPGLWLDASHSFTQLFLSGFHVMQSSFLTQSFDRERGICGVRRMPQILSKVPSCLKDN